mmetsp:Transcript_21015/g.31703  ORF Transcript_21015/g.31703 Transcript_21015/m.31703 type:complete len:92 (+) Transcript_21015:24-299(+)
MLYFTSITQGSSRLKVAINFRMKAIYQYACMFRSVCAFAPIDNMPYCQSEQSKEHFVQNNKGMKLDGFKIKPSVPGCADFKRGQKRQGVMS